MMYCVVTVTTTSGLADLVFDWQAPSLQSAPLYFTAKPATTSTVALLSISCQQSSKAGDRWIGMLSQEGAGQVTS